MNKYIVAGTVRRQPWDESEMPQIWLQTGHAGPVFYTAEDAYKRVSELNRTTDQHSIRNVQAIELRRDDYCPY